MSSVFFGWEEKYTFDASVTDLKKLILSCLLGVRRQVYISSVLAQRNKYIVSVIWMRRDRYNIIPTYI